MINIRKLEADLWESADLLRADSKLTSNQYCMPVLGLIFLRYAYSRFKKVEVEILKKRPSRGGKIMPVEASDFAAKSALYLPREAQYEFLVNLAGDVASKGLTGIDGHPVKSLGEAVNNAMLLIEAQSEQLTGIWKSATVNRKTGNDCTGAAIPTISQKLRNCLLFLNILQTKS